MIGRIKKRGINFLLVEEKGRAIERVLRKENNIFEGGLYVAADKETNLPREEREEKEKVRENIRKKNGRMQYGLTRRKVPPPPEGSFIFTSRAYIEPSYLKHFKDYQIEGVRFMFERLRSANGAVLADEMGLGKTFQAIAIARLFCRAGGRVLVVSPCSLAAVWEKEVQKWASEISMYNGVHNSPEKYRGREDILLLSYEKLSTWKSMDEHEISLVICDEAHRLRTCTSRALTSLKKLESKRLLLTGTPFQNTIVEYKTLLGLVDERVASAKGTKELSTIAGEAVLRRKIERTSISLPQKDEIIWLIRNKEYKETKREYAREGSSMGIQALQKLRAYLSSLPSKWQLFCTLVEKILSEGRSLIVVSRYVEGVKRAQREIAELGRKRKVPISPNSVYMFHGEMSVSERESSISSFNAPGQKVIVLSAKCGGEGLTLVKATRMIILDSDWNPANDLQVMARIWRLGQTRPVVIHRLFIMGSIEEHVLLVQMKKKELQKQVEAEGDRIDEAGKTGTSIGEPEEVLGMFVLRKDSVVHAWIGCQCTAENSATIDEYAHIHEEDALVLRKRVNEAR